MQLSLQVQPHKIILKMQSIRDKIQLQLRVVQSEFLVLSSLRKIQRLLSLITTHDQPSPAHINLKVKLFKWAERDVRHGSGQCYINGSTTSTRLHKTQLCSQVSLSGCLPDKQETGECAGARTSRSDHKHNGAMSSVWGTKWPRCLSHRAVGRSSSRPSSHQKPHEMINETSACLVQPKTTSGQWDSHIFQSFSLGNYGQCFRLLSRVRSPVFVQRRFVKSLRVEDEKVVSREDILKVMTEKNMTHTQGFTCFVTKCPRLMLTNKRSSAGKDSSQMFINATTGHFLCQHCHKRGNWQDLQDNVEVVSSLSLKRKKEYECFKDVAGVQSTDQTSRLVQDAWEAAMPVKTCSTDLFTQIQEHFDIHELQVGTLERYGVRYHLQTNSLLMPAFSGTGRLVGLRRLTCTVPQENDNLRVVTDTLLPRSGVFGLFGLTTLTREVDEIVLTCSELDAMAVCQETKVPALALPAGFSSLPQEILPALERFTKLVLWFGDDVRAWEAAKLFAKKLNDQRCCIIRPSADDPSPFQALRGGVEVRSVLSKARPFAHKSILSFAQLRQEIFSELSHVDQVAGVKWKRYTAMNRLLKGHRRGELTVFTGPTGSGKTTFMSDYSLDLCMQGVNTLWGSFEINNVRLGKMMLTQFAQFNLSKNLLDFDPWADKFEELPMYFMTFFGQENIKKVIEAMSHAVYVHDIAHVVVDNLQFMMGTNSEWNDRFAKQDSFIGAFRTFATAMNCHVTLVIHPRKEKDSEDLTTASVFGSAKATQEADNVLILQDKRLSSVRGRKYLQVTKNRFDGELGVMLLKFDKDSLSFALKDGKKDKDKDGKDYDRKDSDKDFRDGTGHGDDYH